MVLPGGVVLGVVELHAGRLGQAPNSFSHPGSLLPPLPTALPQVGGLGDVVTALGRAVQERGNLVEVILPK